MIEQHAHEAFASAFGHELAAGGEFGLVRSAAEAVLEAGLCLAWEELPVSMRKKRSRPKMLVLGLGKLGGGEMSYNSDLDIMFI